MKTWLCLILALALTAASSLAAGAAPEKQRTREAAVREFGRRSLDQQAALAAETQPGSLFIIAPQAYYSSHGTIETDTMAPGMNLKSEGGHLTGADLVLLYNAELTSSSRLSLMYQIARSEYSGGVMVPEAAYRQPGMRFRTDQRITSNIFGVLADVDLGGYGRLHANLIQGFDAYSGHEKIYYQKQLIKKESLADFNDRVTSGIIFYEYDLKLSPGWTATPFTGWRTFYAHVNNQNNVILDPGDPGDQAGGHYWLHFGTVGAKLAYKAGPLEMTFRGGVNHRFSRVDLPGFGNRAVYPAVVQFGYNANFDKTVGLWGLGINWTVPRKCFLAFAYDGFGGADTASHMITLTTVIPF